MLVFTMNRIILYMTVITAMLSVAMLVSDCTSGRLERLLKSQNLIGINLSGADAYNLSLEGINLTRARLVRTSFTFCNLKKSLFVNADLRFADMSAADMSGADLRGANLRGSICHNTILRKAILIEAYFYDADLSGADLRGAVMASETPDGDGAGSAPDRTPGSMPYYAHFRNADFNGSSVSVRWKDFIKNQGVKNFDKILWAR
jgi:uncharacterized protein YjbI with pentapeptide repeats